MGMIAMDSLTAGAFDGALSPVGLGIGGLFVAATLVVATVYLDFLDVASMREKTLRDSTLSVLIPLLLTFAAIVVYQIAATV